MEFNYHPSKLRSFVAFANSITAATAIAMILCTLPLAAQDDFDLPEFLPGLIAEYSSQDATVKRVDPDLHFDWGDAAPDRRLGAGQPFSARWSGYLLARANGRFQLKLFGQGKLRIRLAGKQLLSAESDQPQWFECEPVELRFGEHELNIEFEKTSETARLGLFWEGPGYGTEPVTPGYLFHATDRTPEDNFNQGRTLSRGLRCAACHQFSGPQVSHNPAELLAAPALTHLQDNLRPEWLVDRLMSRATEEEFRSSRMPHFALSEDDARAITAALFACSAESPAPADMEAEVRQMNRERGKKVEPLPTTADESRGKVAFVSIGCVSCHQIDQLQLETGSSADSLERQMYAGSELSNLKTKRTPEFVRRLLQNPALVNSNHRMPIFELSPLEQLDLAAYLNQLETGTEPRVKAISKAPLGSNSISEQDAERGAMLIRQHRCGACHQLPPELAAHELVKSRIAEDTDWSAGCLGEPDARAAQPGFGLPEDHRRSLQAYYSSVNPAALGGGPSGAELLLEHNCVACHARDQWGGIKSRLGSIAGAVPEVAPRLSALAPPALTGVGDKLHAAALRSAIQRDAKPLRPWLDVRMPKFNLSERSLDDLIQYLIAHDRVPDLPPGEAQFAASNPPSGQAATDDKSRDEKEVELAAARLVTAEGFGCQSCHQIGDGEPPKVDLNARGTDLAMLGERIRPTWFARWVRNPSRIVPRMEMPAIQSPVQGVLSNSLDVQLEALWRTLNTPGFRPPRANPVRVVRAHNLPELNERAHLLTDVIETPNKVYLRPLAFGLPNRHNFLFDLEAGNLAAWWLGDTARQHTRGKTWFWEPGTVLLGAGDQADAAPPPPLESIALIDGSGNLWSATPQGQFATRLDRFQHIEGGIQWSGRLHLSNPAGDQSRWLSLTQSVYASSKGQQAETRVITEIFDLEPGEQVEITSAASWSQDPRSEARASAPGKQIAGQLPEGVQVLATTGQLRRRSEHVLQLGPSPSDASRVAWQSTFQSLLTTDQFPLVEVAAPVLPPQNIDVVPGYAGVQLPLPNTEMPISFAWDEGGNFYAGSLRGRVLRVLDRDADGLSETYEVISDEIPTPFGLQAHAEGIDALAKYALLRLTPPVDSAGKGTPYDTTVLADGWGYTADYHDWAIGLERDPQGNYYMALPCQQDDRSQAAAYLRGQAIKLVPYGASQDERQYRIEPIAAGLRFPIGIALSESGDLFTSDNQGNYNPFNELNHLRQGKRYGFINKLENVDGFSPPFESPAINVPHPWTRSVNGLCFLRTPDKLRSSGDHFGPFEGHLVGCEMNGKALIRMSLQKVGDTYQGAAYMFSRPVAEGEANFEGPIVCEVSPNGDLMVGSLQDSGWSGGQNTGSIVRLRPSGELPLGIAEVRANPTGFEIEFTKPVDSRRAMDKANYGLRSYQRISTPAYGGDDQDVRNEKIAAIELSGDLRRVTLTLNDLRAGFVYEINLGPIGATDDALFPAQAHYTLRSIP